MWGAVAPVAQEGGGAGGLPPGGRYVRAAYDNTGEEDDELSFNEGDQIYQVCVLLNSMG